MKLVSATKVKFNNLNCFMMIPRGLPAPSLLTLGILIAFAIAPASAAFRLPTDEGTSDKLTQHLPRFWLHYFLIILRVFSLFSNMVKH